MCLCLVSALSWWRAHAGRSTFLRGALHRPPRPAARTHTHHTHKSWMTRYFYGRVVCTKALPQADIYTQCTRLPRHGPPLPAWVRRSDLCSAAVWPDKRCALGYSLSNLFTPLHLPLSCHSQLCRSHSHATCGLSFAAASASALMQPQPLAQPCCCSLACAMAESATMSCSAASSAACHVRRAQHVRCCCTAVQRLYYYAHYTHCTGCTTPTTPTTPTMLTIRVRWPAR